MTIAAYLWAGEAWGMAISTGRIVMPTVKEKAAAGAERTGAGAKEQLRGVADAALKKLEHPKDAAQNG